MSKPALTDPFHTDEFARLCRECDSKQLTISLLRAHLEWALERVEPLPEDDMETYHDKWNVSFGLIQEG